ncbi:aminotransferase class I/II-fold pyridoxal phosphate-dependent enzyme [Kitasatospora aureofaciens]|uniref:aminotransferase class I/II-fold pyridoxal phosphate-dependent enzyme n=1 Tax=Kitasatospora aureofaciens TaxID=1894 RepID=UPI0027E02E38|nr:aminotransferase class I/II-fold pyridoxal phosphate-dependent enzyme [Kitasatospora aureofaciens]
MTADTARSAAPQALTLDDYAALARERLDPSLWDFIQGGAGEERTLSRNLLAFDRMRLRTRVLTGVSEVDTSVTVLGRRWAAPVGVAPMAYHTLVHPGGEIATVQAAGVAGLPVVVSTFAGQPFDKLAAAASSPLWLQVYCFRDRETTRQLIERAEQAGFEALVLTVDTPRLGRRLRDLRNDFRLPAGIVPANLPPADYSSPSGHGRAELDPALDWSVVSWLRSVSNLPVLLKGITTGEDATRAIEAGVDGVIVSNHGGRQLDGTYGTLEVLADVAGAVGGRCPVLLDGGVRRGTDVLTALALGADAVLLGRPVLHGLAVAGQTGVTGVFDILVGEFEDALLLTGTRSAADAGPAVLEPGPSTVPAPRAAAPAEQPSTPGVLRKEELHASVSDPVLDTMNFLNEVTIRYPEAVSFAPGRPYEGFFDTEQLFTHIRRYLDHLAEQGDTPEGIRTKLFQYGPTAGLINGLIADSLRKDEGIDVTPASIVVTVGCQEAMFLTVRALFAGPQDVLLTTSPCYVGITGAAALLGIPVTAIEEGPDGLSCAAVEAAVLAERARGRRPRALYVVPDHSNPSGNTMPRQTREDLLALAERLDLLLIEDNPYRLVSTGTRLPTLKSLDTGRRVVHLGSYSKTAFPGARIGFVVADQPVEDASGATGLLADELAKIKSMVTVNTPPLSQAAVAGLLLAADGRLSELNAGPAAHYGDVLAAVLEQLERHFPEARRRELGISWNVPSGGFFLTVNVPFAVDNTALLRSAEEHGVIWTPMSYFYPQGGGEHEMRLSFSYLTRADVEDGIARLARFVEAEAAATAVDGPGR